MTNKKNRVGVRNKNKIGQWYTSIEYINSHNVIIKFDNSDYTKKVTWQSFKDGAISSDEEALKSYLLYILKEYIKETKTIPTNKDVNSEFCVSSGMYHKYFSGLNNAIAECRADDAINSIYIEDRTLLSKKFGVMTVIKDLGIDYIYQTKNKRGKMYLCKCDCGNEKRVYGQDLISKKVTSCGCGVWKSSLTKKENIYDLTGCFGVGISSNGRKFYFDLEDYEKIKEYCWCVGADGRVHTNTGEGKQLRMHKIIMDDIPSNIIIDHINRQPWDNRKENLRTATKTQNNMNADRKKTNTSGVTGLSWVKENKRWDAYLGVNGKRIKLGYFVDKKEAVKARLEAEMKYYGFDFAPQKHLFEEYGVSKNE